MVAWRCLLRRISDAPACWRQPPASWTTARSVSSDRPGSAPDLQPGGAKPNRRRRPAAKPGTKGHLYVALEDHKENGFAIHKLDIDDGVHSGFTDEPPPLPPPVVHLPLLTHVDTKPTRFAALGSSIVALGMRRTRNSTSLGGVTVVYDTDTAMLTESHLLPTGMFYGHDVAVATGNRLYLLESYSTPFEYSLGKYHGGLHCLKTTADPKDERENDKWCRWRWQAFPESSRFYWSSKTFPPALPFHPKSITAHVIHPRGRTILVSSSPLGTFSYGTESGRWRRRGNWMLPFKGSACYDRDLDAWAGLYLNPHDIDAHRNKTAAGDDVHLCASRVTSARRGQPPEWKKVSIHDLSVFHSNDAHWSDLDVKIQLLYMRERHEYCLVEYLDNHVLRLTVFRLSYGDDGELVVASVQPARSYEMPTYYKECFDDTDFGSQAFWM
ncbi:hypothetical protein ACQ4PT_070056 [Festuca glaucescens]